MGMKTPKAIGYVRVSTEEQAAEGYSLAAQRAKLEQYVRLYGMELLDVAADEGLSGKRADNRPGLQRALGMLERGEVQALVVLKLDRLSRSTRDVLDFVERSDREGWSVHSISEKLDTSSADGRFVVTILAALAQMEREQIGERTSAAMSHMKRQGLRVGSIPFGFDLGDDGRTLIANAREQEIILEARRLLASGWSRRRIAEELNRRNVPTKGASRWTHVQVGRILVAA
jgi:DNA invertase Pin-like site-specific DNA recombinase